MIKRFKSFNSKAFLLIYLAVIALMLIFWMSRFDLYPPDKRSIPAPLAPYLQSPIHPLPQFLLHNVRNEQVLTNASLTGHWSFVYFTHGLCYAECEENYRTLLQLQSQFTQHVAQVMLINYDFHPVSIEALKELSKQNTYTSLSFLSSATESELAPLQKALNFLFLKTNTDTGYFLEQEHRIYLLDPKGRFYASFKAMSAEEITEQFLSIRAYYASSE